MTHAPSGSGFDSGTTLDMEKSHGEKLVLYTAFHRMDQHGGSAGRTEHTITVTSSFAGRHLLNMSFSAFDRCCRKSPRATPKRNNRIESNNS